MFSWRKLFGLPEPTQKASPALAAGRHAFIDSQLDDDADPPPEYERYRIARQVVLLRPKEPYARWVHQSIRRSDRELRKIPEYAKTLSKDRSMPPLAQMRGDCTAYLIELHDDEDLSAQEHVERDYLFFFKRELEQWEEDENRWPSNLTLALFRQWFDLECFDMVLDTTKV